MGEPRTPAAADQKIVALLCGCASATSAGSRHESPMPWRGSGAAPRGYVHCGPAAGSPRVPTNGRHTPTTARASPCIRKGSHVFDVSLYLPHFCAHSGQGEPTRTRKRAQQPPYGRSPAARKMDKSPMTLHPHPARGNKISRAKRSELADLVSCSWISYSCPGL